MKQCAQGKQPLKYLSLQMQCVNQEYRINGGIIVGHGIGLEVNDFPLFEPNDTTVLEDGMTFAAETPYYEIGLGGIQPEAKVVIRNDGPEHLTTINCKFEIMGT